MNLSCIFCLTGIGQVKNAKPINVWVYGNCDEVELFLNDKSLGRKPMPKLSHAQWDVNYEPGTLLAKGYKANKEIITDKSRNHRRTCRNSSRFPTAIQSKPMAKMYRLLPSRLKTIRGVSFQPQAMKYHSLFPGRAKSSASATATLPATSRKCSSISQGLS